MPRDKGDEYSRESSNKDAGLEALARFLDTRFSLFGIRFGFDSLIGLVPGVGDAASGGIGAYLIYRAWREGAGFFLIIRMLWNWLLDMIFGSIPILGDIFDVAFKSNLMNVRLLQRHMEKKKR